MNELPVTIPKQPVLKPAEDFYRLRREGIGFIEQAGSRSWTDYNTHDPGITILEALSYAITDLAYRIGWDIKDILASPGKPADLSEPFPNQSFVTARKILTINPITPDDFRRLLIDLDEVRNAWLFCKQCACDVLYYGWCDEDQLVLSYQKPANPRIDAKKVEPLGLYEVLLELESDPDLGDLNGRKIEHRYTVFDPEDKPHHVIMELRFPEWGLQQRGALKLFLDSSDAFAARNGASFNVKITRFGAAKNYDLRSDPKLNDAQRKRYLREHWRNTFYASFEIEILPAGATIHIENAALRIFTDGFVRDQASVGGLETVLAEKSSRGFIQRYRSKLLRINTAVDRAKATLHSHRNLEEDYCHIKLVDLEEVAVCSDVEVAPSADIDKVQAQIWLTIEGYLNPPVPFYSWQELVGAGTAVEDIFNGPELNNGFVKTKELEAAGLKTVLRTSDIINLLMDIEGVVAVNNLLLSKYDAEGNIIKGAADPTWQDGNAIFDPEKISGSWLLFISDLQQPRLYHNQSRFLFYKDGLPFLPRLDEAYDTLTQLRGESERPKLKNAPKDLPVPAGTFRNPENYTPVQYSFPLTYGIGPNQLPSHASNKRRAQARQLKAYLLVFEQLLGNAFAQLAHTADLFSLDPKIAHTYFVKAFTEELMQGYDDVTSGLNLTELQKLVETPAEFEERRNRFLNHVMARFGENFDEYTLLLTDFQGRQVALKRLIEDKISFLKAYPLISHDRGKAFNYRETPYSAENIPGLKKRVSLLLGYPDLTFKWKVSGSYTVTEYQLEDSNGNVWMGGALTANITDADEPNAKQMAYDAVIVQMTQDGAYEIIDEGGGFRLRLKDENGDPMGQHPEISKTKAEAEALKQELLSWSSNDRAIIVEHLLLRPKFPGDALYPACTEDGCQTCGDEDPYSFRLTFVMPGWSVPFNENLEMRGFADRTIRRETPSHLLPKICWVGNAGFIEDLCDPVIGQLAELLLAKGVTAGGAKPTETDACDCAKAIYTTFSKVFQEWYEPRTLDYFHPDALTTELANEFNAKVNPQAISCTTVLDAPLWSEIQTLMVNRFHDIALYGWQFERFEDAWCKWLDANGVFEWSEERLQDHVEAILGSNVESGPAGKNQKDELCKCAAAIVTAYGMEFYNWMRANLDAGHPLDSFTSFTPSQVALCPGFNFKTGTRERIEEVLKERYHTYREVSYRLWILLSLLSRLRSTYPPASLHDCDVGSDQNPVRLGKTALGSL